MVRLEFNSYYFDMLKIARLQLKYASDSAGISPERKDIIDALLDRMQAVRDNIPYIGDRRDAGTAVLESYKFEDGRFDVDVLTETADVLEQPFMKLYRHPRVNLQHVANLARKSHKHISDEKALYERISNLDK